MAGKPILEDGTVSDKYTVALAYSDEWISEGYRNYFNTKQDLKRLEKTETRNENDALVKGLTAYAAILGRDEGFRRAKSASLPQAEKSLHEQIYKEIEKKLKMVRQLA